MPTPDVAKLDHKTGHQSQLYEFHVFCPPSLVAGFTQQNAYFSVYLHGKQWYWVVKFCALPQNISPNSCISYPDHEKVDIVFRISTLYFLLICEVKYTDENLHSWILLVLIKRPQVNRSESGHTI